MRAVRVGLLSVILVLSGLLPSIAAADPPDFTGQPAADAYETIGDQTTEPSKHAELSEPRTSSISEVPAFVEYRWVIVCMNPGSGHDMRAETDCAGAYVCSSPRQRLYRLWGRAEEESGWQTLHSTELHRR